MRLSFYSVPHHLLPLSSSSRLAWFRLPPSASLDGLLSKEARTRRLEVAGLPAVLAMPPPAPRGSRPAGCNGGSMLGLLLLLACGCFVAAARWGGAGLRPDSRKMAGAVFYVDGDLKQMQEEGGRGGGGRRRLLAGGPGPGSHPPRCTSKCGSCSPCVPVHVSVPPGVLLTTEYYPVAWRCKCRDRFYMP